MLREGAMFAFLAKLLLVARSQLKSRASLEAENLVCPSYMDLSLVKTSNPNVLMMEPAEDRSRYDAADLLGLPKIRHILVQ